MKIKVLGSGLHVEQVQQTVRTLVVLHMYEL